MTDQRFKFAKESPFWYFLAYSAVQNGKRELPSTLEALNGRAESIGLPIVYHPGHASAWAVACQLFVITEPRVGSLGQLGWNIMLRGFDGILMPQGFARKAFERVIGNIRSPAFPGRSRDESVADTFLAGGLKLIDEQRVDPAEDAIILQACLQDETMHALGAKACNPDPRLWNDTVDEYSRKRPGVLRRNFTHPSSWLID